MNNNIKHQRYESIILNVINETIVKEINDKIAKFGRVTYVKLTNDLSIATAFIECLDRDKVEQVCAALNKISGLFRSKVAHALDIYKTPKILFKPDKSIDYAQNIDRIIEKLNKDKK